MSQSLAVILVNYENYTLTLELLDSFKHQTDKNFKVFVSDLSKEKQTLTHDVPIRVIAGENRGFSYGNNLALKAAKEEGYTLFAVLNNDTRVPDNFIAQCLYSAGQHPSSIIGAKIYYEKGYEYHKQKYSLSQLGKILWYAGGKTDWNHAYSIHRGVDEVDNGQYNETQPTDFITGCFMLYSDDVLKKVGYWNESYFLYYEDADYCERAKRVGVALVYDPSITLWHKISQSTGGSGSKLQEKYQERNRILFSYRYGPLKTTLHLLINYIKKRLSIHS